MNETRTRAAVVAIGLAVAAVVLLRTAWVCDDAYITFRVLDNAVSGHGLRWNVVERVQVYTHPLWMLLLLPLVALTRDVYFVSITLSAGLSLATLAILGLRLATNARTAALGLAAALASMAFVDFSTSGLENALAHFLLVVFATRVLSIPANPSLPERTIVVALAALLAVNRLDHVLLVAPAVAWVLARRPFTGSALATGLGLVPLVAWLVFAVVYYGFPFPNTAWAKLASGIPREDLWVQGLGYLENSVRWDPITLTTIAVAAVLAIFSPPAVRAVALGMVAYVAYVVDVGGDHRSGRFLSAPFVLALVIAVRTDPGKLGTGLVAVAIVALGSLARTPPVSSGPDLLLQDLDRHRIADERAFYYRRSGLLRRVPDGPLAETPQLRTGSEAAARGTRVVVEGMVGWFAYGAGPYVHVLDPLGLTDPLLARMPMRAGTWRVGHYPRDLPEGYLGWVVGQGVVGDPDLDAYLQSLYQVTRGPLWTWDRWRAIVALNLGDDDERLQQYCERWCSIVPPEPLRTTEGRPDKRPFPIPEHGVAVDARPDRTHATRLLLSVAPGRYEVELRAGAVTIGAVSLDVAPNGTEEMVAAEVVLAAASRPFTSVRLFGPPDARVSTMELVNQ